MNKFVINGKFLTDNIQGISRYGIEMTKALDKVVTEDVKIVLLKPSATKINVCLSNIEQIEYGKHTGILWEQIDLSHYLRKHKDYLCINFCNICPLFVRPGITVVHDIMYKLFPENYSSIRNKISRAWHCFQYWYIARHEMKIITVSNFSKDDIERIYPKASGKIDVLYSAWQHVKNYRENPNWQSKYPFLQDKKYYFSLSQLSRNKNGKWIIEVAKRNPNCIFAMGGKIYEKESENFPDNVKLLGFVPDEDACSLIKHCKAFIFPSVYEGFGLPPLEAIGLGTEAIVSKASCLPEIYGDSVHYIDPYDYDINLDYLLNKQIDNRNAILNKYGWDISAKKLLKILCNYSV